MQEVGYKSKPGYQEKSRKRDAVENAKHSDDSKDKRGEER